MARHRFASLLPAAVRLEDAFEFEFGFCLAGDRGALFGPFFFFLVFFYVWFWAGLFYGQVD